MHCCNMQQQFKKTSKSEDTCNIKYYRFPKNLKLRQIWIQRCRRDGKWNADTSRVCSEHFSEDAYEKDLKAELLQLPPTKKLKPDSVPTLKLIGLPNRETCLS